MPVQFKSMSEYKSHFTPVYPKHSAASTAPLVDEMIIQDTPNSDKVCPEHKVFSECEPPLQRKKRAPAPVTSLSSDFYDTSKPAAEDYILLGNNEKFVDNIRYRNRSSNNCKNLGEFNFNRDVSPPKIQKTKSYKENLEPKTAPGPVVDTTAYRGAPVTPSTPMTPREPKDAQTALQLSQKQQRNAVTDKTATKGGDKYKTKENDDLRKNITRVLQKEKQAASRAQTKDTVKRPTNPRMKTYVKPWVMSQAARAPAPTETVKDKVKKQAENDPHPTKQKVKVASQVKVIDQEAPEEVSQKTVRRQGTKQAAQEDQSDYSLKYKAGVNRPKRQTPLRKSEYQREFEWKNAVKASPLIDAEQMVYQSRVNSAPSKPDMIPKLSEYRAQFLQYPFVPADYTAPPTPSDKGPQKSASKIKRSKSVGAIDVSKGEESQSVVPPDPKQIIGESMATKHGKYRARGKSEYARNFQAPWKYEYVNGAWKASPPHLEQEVGQEEAALPSDPMTSWFREVMELRQKAAEYRKRAQGTHFSREHLVQLMARQVELWDQLSEGSRTLSALSLEAHASHSQPGPMTADVTEAGDEPDEESEVVSPGSSSIQQESQKVEKVQTAKTGTKKQNRIRELSKKLEYSSADNGSTISQSLRTQSSERDEPDVESEQLSPETSQPKRSTKGRKGAAKTKPKPKSSKLKKGKQKPAKDSQEVKSAWQEDTNDGVANPDQPDEDEGRIPTPTLKQRAVNQPVMRHHLDRTTPSVGGAILTSPTNQRKVYTAPPVFGSGYQSCDEDSDSDSMPFRGASPPSAGEETNRFAARQAETFPKRTFPLGKVGASPTFGRPSGDTHFLRDDSASSDRPLNTQFVDSPLKPNTATDVEDPTDKYPVKRPSIKSGMGVINNQPDQSHISNLPKPFYWSLDGGNFVPRRTYSDDDDVLSVSARSIASSCSLASEVLERAQKRHNDFWGRRMHQTR